MAAKDTNTHYDLIVVGGGPGGYVSAIRAAQLGLKTALVEREHLGGICLNWGCIPTKALLRSAEVLQQIERAEEFGISVQGVSFDLAKMVARSRKVAKTLNGGIGHLLRKNKVAHIAGMGRLTGKGKMEVSTDKGVEAFSAEHIILATGARARALPGLEPDGKQIWSYREAMTPAALPKSLLIMGAGAIGIEFACFYNALGVDVTVVEAMGQILPFEDAEVADYARQAFTKEGIKILTGALVKKLDKSADRVEASIEVDGKVTRLKVEKVISAVGVVGNIEQIGLENTAVETEGPFIKTDEWSRTAEPGVYAIGDVAGAPCLAHKASHEGIICVEKLFGLEGLHPLDRKSIPGCTYSHPQVASVGMTEQKARDAGHELRVGRFPLKANGKAIALGEEGGFVKTLFDATTGELLGAHMVGAEVTEMIQGYVVARTLETTEQELMHTVFPHPTLSESMHEAVLDAYGQAIHF